MRIRCPEISLRDEARVPGPGEHRITASIAGRELAAFPFRILSKREWLRCVTVRSGKLIAETVDAERDDTRVLRWLKHVAFRPLFVVETPVPAANTLVRVEWQFTRDGAVLGCGEFMLCLNSPRRDIALDRFELRQSGAGDASRHVRFQLSVRLDGEEKLAWPIMAVAADPICNFEGQLLRDARELSEDDDAYSKIIASLAGSNAQKG